MLNVVYLLQAIRDNNLKLRNHENLQRNKQN